MHDDRTRARSALAALPRRLRALLLTVPLTDLRRNDPYRSAESRHHDSLALAMQVLDQIVDHMGLDRELDRDGLVRAMAPLLEADDAAGGVSPDHARHEAAIDRVVAALRNDEGGRRPFELEYADYDVSGGRITAKYSFRLLFDYFHPSGQLVLHLSDQALNLFLNAIDLDIEDAQTASEAVVQSQMARGRFDDAVLTAKNARVQSRQFESKVVRILRETRRDVANVDWRSGVPQLLEEATRHIQMRLAVEKNIRDTAEERLQVLDEQQGSRAVAEVAELIRDCQLRHMELHERLMGARSVFLDEQVRQSFAPTPRAALPSLAVDVLEPVLISTLAVAEPIAASSIGLFYGATAPVAVSLVNLIGSQLQPRRVRVEPEVELVEPELDEPALESPRFTAEITARSEAALRALERPTTLSGLLESFDASDDEPVRELIALLALRDFASEPEDKPLADVDTSHDALRIRGFVGDDLELRPTRGPDESGG